MRSSFESQTPAKDSSETNAAGPGKATTSTPAISMRVPNPTASASLTRRAWAIDTRWESTAHTAASNGVPKQTGRRPPASDSSRATTGSRPPTSASPLPSTSSDSTRAAWRSTRSAGRSETKSTSTSAAASTHTARSATASPPSSVRATTSGSGSENGPRGRSEIVTRGG